MKDQLDLQLTALEEGRALMARFPLLFSEPMGRHNGPALDVGPGWLPVVADLCLALEHELTPEERTLVRLFEVGEQLGKLDVALWTVGLPAARVVRLQELMAAARKVAEGRCEACGAEPAALFAGPLVKTLCEECERKRVRNDGQ